MSAVDLVGSSGSTGPSFLSRTTERPAAVAGGGAVLGQELLAGGLGGIDVRVVE